MKNTTNSLVVLTLWLVSLLGYGQSDTTARKLWQSYRITPRTGAQHIDLSGGGWGNRGDDPKATDYESLPRTGFQLSCDVLWRAKPTKYA